MSENFQIGLGTIVKKPLDTVEKNAQYDACVKWADENGFVVRERTDYFIVAEQPKVGTKIYKPLDTEEKNYFYADCASWSGWNGCTIKDYGEYFEIIKLEDAPLPELEAYKEQRKWELNAMHDVAEKNAHILSSLGFEINADDKANRNVTGLLVTTEDGDVVSFMDYSNVSRQITKNDLLVMQKEIIENAQNLYLQKWDYRNQIEECETSYALSKLAFSFKYMSFYKQ